MDPLEARGAEETEVAPGRRNPVVEVVTLDLIKVILIIAGSAAFLSWLCSLSKKEAAAMEERKTSPCDYCAFWCECQGQDKEDCVLYKAEDETYV